VKKSTLYAYVSRGLLRRWRADGSSASCFDALEVERLAERGRKGRRVERVSPLFQSAITYMAEDGFYYRGRNACDVAAWRFEDVARLLWDDTLTTDTRFLPDDDVAVVLRAAGEHLPEETLPFDRVKAMLPIAAVLDPLRHDLSMPSLLSRAARVVATLIEPMPVAAPQAALPAGAGRLEFAARLWSRLSREPATDELLAILNTTLVLVADADVTSPTTMAARLGASIKADLYSVLATAMHCSGGTVQSASSLAVESYLEGLGGKSSIGHFVGERLRQGEDLPGFGHSRFPGGDPRARVILDQLRRATSQPRRVERLVEFLGVQERRGVPPPNIGFAIAALVYVAGMVRGSGDLIFAMGRTAGWIAHAIEQYGLPVAPPRSPSIYVGRLPEALPQAAPRVDQRPGERA
jgi:citrate synthase